MGDGSRGTETNGGLLRHVELRSATALVIANVVGAGIFTTTGFQAADVGNPMLIFGLWITGGLLALCGALCYAELGAAMPRAGGEYVYLRETYGGAVGFMSAFVSLVAGFSAPIASVALGFVRYLTHFFPILGEERALVPGVTRNELIALAFVWGLIAIQLRGARGGIRFSDAVTLLKVGGIVAIIAGAAAVGDGDLANLVRVSDVYAKLGPSELYAALGTSLVFVMFCYSGWNASAYLAGEFEHPQRDLPRSLVIGTVVVIALYLGLNGVYFYGAGVEGLAGRVEVGLVAARELFGGAGTTLVTLVLCVSLVASATAMTIAGPRVYYALGRDYPQFAALSRSDPDRGAPVAALVVQGVVTSILVVTGRIDQIMQYAGFTLTLFASLAVSCVITLRVRRPAMERPFRTWGYPLTPILFLAVSVWIMYWAFRGRPLESTLALATVAAGGLLFLLSGASGGGPRAGAGPDSAADPVPPRGS